jgi:hypothetical protein
LEHHFELRSFITEQNDVALAWANVCGAASFLALESIRKSIIGNGG